MTGIPDRRHAGMWWSIALSLSLSAASVESTTITPGIKYALARTPVYDSGATVAVPLIVEGMATCRDVNAVLTQRSYKLAAFLDEKIALDCAAVDHTAEAAISSLEFSFMVPDVKRVTSFIWEFVGCQPDQSCETLGSFEFAALPADFMQPIRAWSATNAIYIEDPDGYLAAFLDTHAIEYVESPRAIAQDVEVVSLVVRSDPSNTAKTEKLPGGQYKRLITFHDNATEIPIVWVESGPGGVAIEVKIPVIHEMSSDAANKKLFYELFQKLF